MKGYLNKMMMMIMKKYSWAEIVLATSLNSKTSKINTKKFKKTAAQMFNKKNCKLKINSFLIFTGKLGIATKEKSEEFLMNIIEYFY